MDDVCCTLMTKVPVVADVGVVVSVLTVVGDSVVNVVGVVVLSTTHKTDNFKLSKLLHSILTYVKIEQFPVNL